MQVVQLFIEGQRVDLFQDEVISITQSDVVDVEE